MEIIERLDDEQTPVTELQIGQVVEIEIATLRGTVVCLTTIKDITPKSLILATPYYNNRPLGIYKSQAITLRTTFVGELYTAQIELISKTTSPIEIWEVTYPTDLQPAPRRMWKRVDIQLPVRVLTPNNEIDTTSLNISGGGIKIATRLQIKKTYGMKIYLPRRTMEVQSTCVWSGAVASGHSFVDLTPEQTDDLQNYIFTATK